MAGSLLRWMTVGLVAVGTAWAGSVQAAMHMSDSVLVGANPAAGEYSLGNLVGQGPTVSSFTGAWTDGRTTTTPGTFDVIGAGLAWPNLDNAAGGAVQFVNDAALTNTQAAIRGFDNPNMVADGNYWLAGMMSFDGNFVADTTSTAYTGELNAEEGDPSVQWTVGCQWGFEGNDTGGVDAVLRVRAKVGSATIVNSFVVATDVQPGNHLFVTYVDSDYVSGVSSDFLQVWFDPVVRGAAYLTGRPSLTVIGQNWLNPSTDPNRIVDTAVVSATNLGAGAVVTYDEIRLGDSWAEVVHDVGPIPSVDAKGALYVNRAFNGYEHVATYLRADIPNRNSGTLDELLVGNSVTGPFRAILSYSLDDVPNGTVVTDAQLRLIVRRVDETGSPLGEIELRLADFPDVFNENECSWDECCLGGAWPGAGGGDPSTTVLGTTSGLVATTTEVTFGSTTEFLAAVQAAVDGDHPLDMVLMMPSLEYSGLRSFVGFYSEDSLDMFLRPVLTLTFEGGEAPHPGDANSDGKVDDLDASILAANWQRTGGATWAQADFNKDGNVNDLDASILAANWQFGVGAAVPEPSLAVLLLGAAMAAWALRRGR